MNSIFALVVHCMLISQRERVTQKLYPIGLESSIFVNHAKTLQSTGITKWKELSYSKATIGFEKRYALANLKNSIFIMFLCPTWTFHRNWTNREKYTTKPLPTKREARLANWILRSVSPFYCCMLFNKENERPKTMPKYQRKGFLSESRNWIFSWIVLLVLFSLMQKLKKERRYFVH